MQTSGKFGNLPISKIFSLSFVDGLFFIRGVFLAFVLARIYPPEDYAIWSQLKVGVATLGIFFLLGLPDSIIKYIRPDSNKLKSSRDFWGIFTFCIGLTVLFLGVMILFRGTFSHLYFSDHSIRYFYIFCFYIAADTFSSLFQALYIARDRFEILNFSKFIEICLDLGILTYSLLTLPDIESLLMYLLMSKTLLWVIRVYLSYRVLGLARPSYQNLGKSLRYALPVFVSLIFVTLFLQVDRFVVLHFFSAKDLGEYAFAYSVAYLTMLALTPIDTIYYQRLSAAVALNQTTITLKEGMGLTVAFGLFACLAVSFTAQSALNALGYDYELAKNTSFIFTLASSFVLFQLGTIVKRALILMERATDVIWSHISSLLVLLAGLALLARPFQVWSVPVSLLLSSGFFLMLNLWMYRLRTERLG